MLATLDAYRRLNADGTTQCGDDDGGARGECAALLGANGRCVRGRCVCARGFELTTTTMEDGANNNSSKVRCVDANECEWGVSCGALGARCVNTLGAYRCECGDGYAGDGLACSREREGILC